MTTKSEKTIYILPKSTYDPKISIMKLVKEAVTVGSLAGVTFLIDSGLPTLELELPQYAALIAIATGILKWAANYLKHSGDQELIEVNGNTGENVVVYKKVGKNIIIGNSESK